MKYKALAVLAAAGVLGISGAAFAGVNASAKFEEMPKLSAKHHDPKIAQAKRPTMPPMSRDHRMPPPPEAHSRDKRPPELRDREKMPPMSRDNRMPPPPEAHSRDKRPPELKR